jgi:hypothetical protein
MDEVQKELEGYRGAIRKEIEGMNQTERAVATAMVLVGETIALLLNQRNWDAIEEVRKVCEEMFREVDRLRDEKRNVQ